MQMTMEDLLRKTNHPDDIRNPVAYLCSFANQIINHLVQLSTRTRINNGKYAAEIGSQPESDRLLTPAEYQTCQKEIMKLLDSLPEGKARLLYLDLFGEMTIDEMCDELGYKSKDVFYSARSQSRRLFRETLEKSDNCRVLKELIILNQTKNEGNRY